MIAAAAAAHAEASQSQNCAGLDAVLGAAPSRVRVGSSPVFTLTLKNISGKAQRLLDVRNGRRGDLQYSYYQLILEQNGRSFDEVPAFVADPGPIAEDDLFALPPNAQVQFLLRTQLVLEALPTGRYDTHVRIRFAPDAGGPCQSTSASVEVVK